MHERLQSSSQSQLLTSPDPSVHLMTEEALKIDLSLTRPKFKVSKEVRDVMTHNHYFSRKSPAAASKLLVTEDDEDRLLNSLQHLEKQGHMFWCSSPDGGKLCAKALNSVSDMHLRFVLIVRLTLCPITQILPDGRRVTMTTVLSVVRGRPLSISSTLVRWQETEE